MGIEQVIALIDAAVKIGTVINNAAGANTRVQEIIAARIADGGRDWTDAERQEITDAVQAAKVYALDQLGKPDAG